jgi:hypothetical protein
VLSQVRLTFTTNQRRHYAVFRARSKLATESEAEFDHYRIRQNLVIEDLKRFNIKVLLIDDYSETTEFLTELVNQYRRRRFMQTRGRSIEDAIVLCILFGSRILLLSQSEIRSSTLMGDGGCISLPRILASMTGFESDRYEALDPLAARSRHPASI